MQCNIQWQDTKQVFYSGTFGDCVDVVNENHNGPDADPAMMLCGKRRANYKNIRESLKTGPCYVNNNGEVMIISKLEFNPKQGAKTHV